jgi:glycerol uptake facilitator-like aquaporin
MGHKLEVLQASTQVRTGIGVWAGEILASFALLATILGCLRAHPDAVPYAVGLVIAAGYRCTSSTSFSNPAVTIARSLRSIPSRHASVAEPGSVGISDQFGGLAQCACWNDERS